MSGERAVISEANTPTRLQTRKLGRTIFSGGLVGIAGIALWLTLWYVLSGGAAQPFSLTTALFAAAVFASSEILARRYRGNIWATGLRVSGCLAIIVAALGGLSIGTFLPAGVAEIVSPVLGRFGGAAGFTALALLFLALAIVRRRAWLLDLALGFGLAALWVGPSVTRQAQFPPPPTNGAVQAERFNTIFFIVLAFLLIALALKYWKEYSFYARSLWRWASFLALLSLSLTLLLDLKDSLLQSVAGGVCVVAAATFSKLFQAQSAKFLAVQAAKYFGALVLMLLATAVLYFFTNDDLEGVLLRNTLERQTAIFWRDIFGDERFATRPTGQIAGRITDEQGKSLSGATVIISGVAGQPYTATSGVDGRYSLKDVPTGNHLPIAARFGYRDEVLRGLDFFNSGREVVTVQAGQVRDNVNFVMKPRPIPVPITADKTLQIAPAEEAFRDNPVPSPVLRSTFTFDNDGMQIKGGILYEPEAAKGSGPFPTLLIIYPGPAASWEGVSIPLAAQGYVVIAYYPQRGIDLAGDMRDVGKLMAFAQAGLFSKRADPARISVVGGSVSTVYVYLLLRDLESSPTRDRVKAAVMYGGLVDMYRFRYDWERAAIYIDPGISELENLLIAFGRPDNRPEHYLLFSTLYHLDQAALPATLLVHADKDSIVPVTQSVTMDAAMTRLAIPHEFLRYPDIEHYLDTSKRDPAQLDMLFKTIDFLKRNATGT